ncbi:hypothetical protein M404DRAFT_26131 [Pisolithus tinctorius Marx 270]|uniref:Uncharacterized protein n=1 Tax=Pisolithus tinctorius Marx 270 TaxID=870435 RepID=A0A0C3P9W5_PISTI|nr:hypothetical protein M404DRAFT_26131 [Pisolithus tinctorius Marx 270]
MQAYSVNDTCPVFSMKDQATTALSEALGHIWDLIEMAPQPEESLDMIYAWVEDWDKTWAGICSWWKYINDNGITILKVCNECMWDYTEESAMCQNLLVPGVITITDLQCPVEKRWIHIDDIFEDYQERVELRVQLKVERLAREPSMCMHRQTARAHKNAGSGEMAAGPSHKQTKSVMVMVTTKTLVTTGLKLRIPAHKPPPRQNSKPTPGHPTPHASPPSTLNMPPPAPQPPLFLPSETPAPQPLPEPTPPPMNNLGDLSNGGLFG